MDRFVVGAKSSSGGSGSGGGNGAAKKPRMLGDEPLLEATLSLGEVSVSLLDEEDIAHAHAAHAAAGKWQSYKGVLYKLSSEGKDRKRTEIVAFDMDGTLITTKSGKTFPLNDDDWRFWDPSVIPKLQLLHAEGKHLAIISNQSGIKAGKTTRPALQAKVDLILAAIGVPVDFFAALEDDVFRKPRTGIWDLMEQIRGAGAGAASTAACAAPAASTASTASNVFSASIGAETVGLEGSEGLEAAAEVRARHASCIYVGDAAGRPAEGKKPLRGKDFNDTDYKFALNVGCQFATPEKFFLNSKHSLHCRLPPPASMRLCMSGPASKTPDLDEDLFKIPSQRTKTPTPTSPTSSTSGSTQKQDIVLLVAPPACGKSRLCMRLEGAGVGADAATDAGASAGVTGYKRVNQDTLGTKQKCLLRAEEHLLAGHSVCVDNTNVDLATRQMWVQLADKLNIQIRCLVLQVPKDVSMLLATYRLVSPVTAPADRRKIQSVTVHTSYKNLIPPTLKEGFTRIDTIAWAPEEPTHPQAKRLFQMFLS